jgi:hypothetical protein
MPDIYMCQDDNCPSAKQCYRHEAKPDQFLQVYGHFERALTADKCDRFIELRTPKPKEPA